MRKKSLLFSILAAGALVTLASCGNDQELEDLKKEVASLKEENSTLKNDKDTLTQSNQTLSDEKKALKDSNDSLKEDYSKVATDFKKLKGDYKTLEGMYESLVDENGELKSDVINYLKAENLYAVKYTDPAGGSKILLFYDSVSLSQAIVDDFNGVISDSGFVSSVKNYYDPNWYVALYENGEYTSVGVNDLVADAGDVFDLKQECWNSKESGYGTLDEFDVLVDKAIYNYYVNVLPKKLKSVDTYTGNTYWDSMALYKLKNAGYKFDSLNYQPFIYDYYHSVDTAVQSELSGNDLFKYYYADRLLINNRDYTDLKTKYQSYLDTLTSYSSYGEYSIPFHTGVAKTLGLNLNDAIKNTTYRADMTYGPEGLAWELAGLACYNTFTKDDLSALTIAALDNEYVGSKDVALSTYILPYAASNISFRELKDSNDQDALKVLFSFYDESTMQFDTEKLSNDMSSNQIYAALVAYKIQRDTNNAQNLFE